MDGSVVVPPAATTPATRPMAVTVVAVLAVLAAGYLLIRGVLLLVDAGDDTGKWVEGAVEIVLGLLSLAIAVGAVRVRPWAWKLFMTVAVVGLTVQLLRYFWFGDPDYARMALQTFVVFALTPRDVQVAFRIRPPANVDLAQSTRNPLDSD
jgi:uncharacterized membrane protein YqjE